MSKIYPVLIALLCFSGIAHSNPNPCDKIPVMHTEKNSIKYGLFITQQQILKAPKWSPESAEPPVSISKAFNIAKSKSKKIFPRYDVVNIKSISIHQYACDSINGYWYYQIQLIPVIEENEVAGASNWVAVLMDGTLITPRKY